MKKNKIELKKLIEDLKAKDLHLKYDFITEDDFDNWCVTVVTPEDLSVGIYSCDLSPTFSNTEDLIAWWEKYGQEVLNAYDKEDWNKIQELIERKKI